MNVSIDKNIKGVNRYIGKITDGTFYREFDYRTAVLWKTKELSMDAEVWKYIQPKVTKLVFQDKKKKTASFISVGSFEKKSREADNGEGNQRYIKLEDLQMQPYKKLPYISEVIQLP